MQMKPPRHAPMKRSARLAQCLIAVMACAAICACASTTRPAEVSAQRANASTATPAAAAQPADVERRNRQFQQAEALYLSGRLKEAAAAFEDLTRAYPRDAHVWLKYGNTLAKQGNYDGAATAFQTALTIDAELGGAAINLAIVRLGQAQGALDIALARAASNSAEHLQAESLQRQIKALLAAPVSGAAATH
jgi:tetratricopeptide (TPR) repeat protein